MPPTVKSLEERIDDMAEEFSALRTQLAVVLNNHNTTQAQLATLVSNQGAAQGQAGIILAKLDNVIDALKGTNARLEETTNRLDALAVDHAFVKARTETTFGLLRWAGVTGFGVLLTVMIAAFSVIRSAAHLESQVEHQGVMIGEVKAELADIRARLK